MKSSSTVSDYGYVTAANGLNLRTHPINGEAIQVLPFATQLVINGEDSGWTHVTVDGIHGWVSGCGYFTKISYCDQSNVVV